MECSPPIRNKVPVRIANLIACRILKIVEHRFAHQPVRIAFNFPARIPALPRLETYFIPGFKTVRWCPFALTWATV
jgi:hypothetical protein